MTFKMSTHNIDQYKNNENHNTINLLMASSNFVASIDNIPWNLAVHSHEIQVLFPQKIMKDISKLCHMSQTLSRSWIFKG